MGDSRQAAADREDQIKYDVDIKQVNQLLENIDASVYKKAIDEMKEVLTGPNGLHGKFVGTLNQHNQLSYLITLLGKIDYSKQ